MAAPHGNYPPQEGYGQPAQPYDQAGYQNATSPPPGAGPAQPAAGAGKKKRAYAGQAYEFGAGANAALGGQPQAGGAYPQQPAQGYPQQPAYDATAAQPGFVGAAPGYGQPEAPAVGGYQPPAPGYPGAQAPGVAGLTQQFGQMGVSGQPQVVQPQTTAQQFAPLNQLYPTDLLHQPFNVAELDYPPPPVILPPNVS